MRPRGETPPILVICTRSLYNSCGPSRSGRSFAGLREPMPLKTWGDFEINFERLLGRGGMGAVYMGRQISLDRPSAIKILKQDLTSNPEFVKRFHREAALLARLVDNHVVQIFGAGEADGQHYY